LLQNPPTLVKDTLFKIISASGGGNPINFPKATKWFYQLENLEKLPPMIMKENGSGSSKFESFKEYERYLFSRVRSLVDSLLENHCQSHRNHYFGNEALRIMQILKAVQEDSLSEDGIEQNHFYLARCLLINDHLEKATFHFGIYLEISSYSTERIQEILECKEVKR
jgi:hypothetical protein